MRHLFVCQGEPRVWHADAGVKKEACQDGGLCKLAQVVDGTLALRNEVEVAGESFRVLHHGVVWPRDRGITQAVAVARYLLPSLHAHLHGRDQDVVLRKLDVRFPDDVPLAALPPLVEALRYGNIKATLHADDWLTVLAHRELLQMVISLEEHFTNARARQPSGFKPLHLQRRLGVVGRVPRVQRERRLHALAEADPECKREVLQVHGGAWLARLRDLHRGRGIVPVLQHQANHALRLAPIPQPAQVVRVARDALRPPADAMKRSGLALPHSFLLLAALLLLLHLLQHEQRHALSVPLALAVVVNV
mmetsp:Transcript_51283/g.164189  ORF Transcript_51283/g.164189 Transcript_51283/m.164189 type:complete len:306 (+) Transcript_51283:1434-2351(+)